MNNKKVVVLLSGGMDSATVLGIAHSLGYELYVISFYYGQRNSKELECAGKLADYYKVKDYKLITVGLNEIGGSALLTDTNLNIPTDRADDSSIPITYVPARNIIFLSIAGAYAEVVGADNIFIGANRGIDERTQSRYPDSQPEFLTAFEDALNKGTKTGVEGKRIKIIAPLLHMTKAEIVKKGMELGVPYIYTWSCYKNNNEYACGKCDACKLRLQGFKDAGYQDVIPYETQ